MKNMNRKSKMNDGGMVLVIKSESPEMENDDMEEKDDMEEMSKGGMSYAKGGMTRGGRDGCAIRGKTKGRMV